MSQFSFIALHVKAWLVLSPSPYSPFHFSFCYEWERNALQHSISPWLSLHNWEH